ncbi:unnamed protein product [Nippostrongylus brasiliensis]|uniref:Uncharacterized protein n=1 Tax=Nippostrongylus brasiliensis TaxID=27835 RepID=A0A0N4YDX6_NIPBR|nr:unnamed protein product [Nippostrongylus brasiliensis]
MSTGVNGPESSKAMVSARKRPRDSQWLPSKPRSDSAICATATRLLSFSLTEGRLDAHDGVVRGAESDGSTLILDEADPTFVEGNNEVVADESAQGMRSKRLLANKCWED